MVYFYNPLPVYTISFLDQGIAPMSGYLGVFTIDINAVCSPEGAVKGKSLSNSPLDQNCVSCDFSFTLLPAD